MDVYALTRKKRPTNPTMATVLSTLQNTVQSQLLPPSQIPYTRIIVSNPAFHSQLGRAVHASSPQEAKVVVTGPPTRAHWKPDSNAVFCNSCELQFNFFDRRHHCRKCGDIFCANCSSKLIRLDQNAEFNTSGRLCRACDCCFEASLNNFKPRPPRRKISNIRKELSLPTKSQAHSSPSMLTPTNVNRIEINSRPKPIDSFIQPIPSVSRDWSWSTF
ncbi:Zn finger protein [Basidiobolus ranarum]|uniref:Zn finger protein n=1 Tax=Basidiobolus ranarum TaxID=34480 RepID=A0ABR2W1A9_9FUNG